MKNIKIVIVSKTRIAILNKLLIVIALSITLLGLSSCGSNDSGNGQVKTEEKKAEAPPEDNGKGIGPVSSVNIGPIDEANAAAGKKLFDVKCTACHKDSKEKVVGPGLLGVTERRKPEWIMNQILNPLEMTQKDSTSKGLLAIYKAQMTNQNLTQDEARNVLEYFRKSDKEQAK